MRFDVALKVYTGFMAIILGAIIWLGISTGLEMGDFRLTPCKEPVAQRFIAMTRQPGWEAGEFVAWRGDAKVWIANGASGLGIAAGDDDIRPDSGSLSMACRVELMDAIKSNVLPAIHAAERARILRALTGPKAVAG